MSILAKRPLHVLSNKLRWRRQPVERMKEKWIADFSKPEKSCFTIKPEIAYNAYLEKRSLFLGLKKKNCMAWLETTNRMYVDQIIDARFRFDGHGEYCAAGIMFRVMELGTYYLALVSSKGYFRLDAVNCHIPRPLIGWTEAPRLNGNNVNLGIIARGDHLIILLNGKWIAEARDASIPGGHLGFALASYETDSPPSINQNLVCQSWLNFLSVDARPGAVAAEYNKWCNALEISAESRLRLAESFAALDYFDAAYAQILRAWKQREEAAQSVMATYTDARTGSELLFAAQMALKLGQYSTAEEYLNTRLAMGVTGADALTIGAEMAKTMSALGKYKELAAFLPDYIKRAKAEEKHADIPPLYALFGHALWNLKDYKAAASAWGAAFSLDAHNGLYAANAANAFEQLGKTRKALQYGLDAAQCFLRQKNYTELGALVPKLLALGKNNQEACTLARQWAAVTSDDNYEEPELAAEKPAGKTKAKPAAPVKKTKAKPKAVTSSKTPAKRTVAMSKRGTKNKA